MRLVTFECRNGRRSVPATRALSRGRIVDLVASYGAKLADRMPGSCAMRSRSRPRKNHDRVLRGTGAEPVGCRGGDRVRPRDGSAKDLRGPRVPG